MEARSRAEGKTRPREYGDIEALANQGFDEQYPHKDPVNCKLTNISQSKRII